MKTDIRGTFPLKQGFVAIQSLAVAAAAIIARESFLSYLVELSQKYGLNFPKGATHVIDSGKRFVQKYGSQKLNKVCKLHFKTSTELL